ncbi:DUF3108 domain-containing protein [Sedimenticola hydrogenitrophicus]|uniref:DUF3108 domain-containing protein n=1 Tax=Sedimenticola hydrogenitrophicus TaxID=2967975 RepID=UPI0023AFF4C3|nr:DUF3108 domain-containing protein [Sedimenticola hydrogenitrophicus]
MSARGAGLLLGLLLTALALSPPGTAGAETGQPLRPFRAEYRLSMGNLVIGRANITLRLSGEGRYTYRAYTTPVGLVAVFRDDEITEQSQGRVVNDRIIPSRYLYTHKRPKRTRQVNLDFDWQAGKVANQSADSHWSMEIPEGTQDKFSQQLALMLALNRGDKAAEYQVADGGLLKRYRYTEVSREPVATESGEYQAIKLARNKGDRPSRATFWFAPNLNFLPVRVTKHEKDGDYVMELVSVTWQDGGS